MSGMNIIMLAHSIPVEIACVALGMVVAAWVAGGVGLVLSFYRNRRASAVGLAIVSMGPTLLWGVMYLHAGLKDGHDWNMADALSHAWDVWCALILGPPFLLGAITLIRVYSLHRKEKNQPLRERNANRRNDGSNGGCA